MESQVVKKQGVQRVAMDWTASRRAVIGVVVMALAAGVYWRAWNGAQCVAQEGAVDERLGLRIDPNSATWSELAALPGMGEKSAKALVAYRQHALSGGGIAFGKLADLDAVPGIGPARIKMLEPFLIFPR